MRLRMRIERNELPAVQVLWAIADTELKHTIAQLLERVNDRFPLEGETWGLDEYSVTVSGYEATHYAELGTTFKDEDEVLIKPLGWAELRTRTITGRDQISSDGRHLLDGVPFGRPMLKRPRRPEVRIPPRKKQRLQVESGIVNGNVDEQAMVRFVEELEDEEDDDEEDEDFEGGTDVEELENEEEAPSESSGSASDEHDSSDSSSDDGDEDTSSSGSSSSDDSSESEAESEQAKAGDSEPEWNGIDDIYIATNAEQPMPGQQLPNGIPNDVTHSIPNEGKLATKNRNTRRRDSRRLKHLKETGILPSSAGIKDYYTWQESNSYTNYEALIKSTEGSSGQQSALPSGTRPQADFETQRQKLLSQIADGGVEVMTPVKANGFTEDNEPPDEEPIRHVEEAVIEVQTSVSRIPSEEPPPNPYVEEVSDTMPPARRPRLELQSANRLVFGSLGLRTPKTQEERDALQKKLATRPKKLAPTEATAGAAVEATENGVEEDPEAWREKIILTAVECVDEGVVLSAPPFPFQQRWDPQYCNNKTKRKASGTKPKRNKKQHRDYFENGEFVETYDKYNKDGGGDALNYDDPENEEEEFDDSYWEEGALLEDEGADGELLQLDQDAHIWPALPKDRSSLPVLEPNLAKVGDFIIFAGLSVSAATNWAPQVVSKVAQLVEQTYLEQEDESEEAIETPSKQSLWTIKEMPEHPKQYDDEGNRVYEKFEMEEYSDDGAEEEVVHSVKLGELQDLRLLKREVM